MTTQEDEDSLRAGALTASFAGEAWDECVAPKEAWRRGLGPIKAMFTLYSTPPPYIPCPHLPQSVRHSEGRWGMGQVEGMWFVRSHVHTL